MYSGEMAILNFIYGSNLSWMQSCLSANCIFKKIIFKLEFHVFGALPNRNSSPL